MPAEFDPTVPSIARVYDYWLGGKNHFTADRELADRLLEIYPPVAEMATDNRRFFNRAAAWVAGQGVRQFLDLGSGLPTPPNMHEAVHLVAPGARVVYLDNDPVALAHGRVMAKSPNVRMVAGDLADSAAVLSDPEVAGFIDLSAPVCVILALVLHFFDAASARDLVARYLEELAPGSYVIVTIGRGDGEVADRFFSAYNAAKLYNHPQADFASFFDFPSLTLVPPGITEAAAWEPGRTGVRVIERRPGQVLAGVARVG